METYRRSHLALMTSSLAPDDNDGNSSSWVVVSYLMSILTRHLLLIITIVIRIIIAGYMRRRDNITSNCFNVDSSILIMFLNIQDIIQL